MVTKGIMIIAPFVELNSWQKIILIYCMKDILQMIDITGFASPASRTSRSNFNGL
jgi:hypothetical protein